MDVDVSRTKLSVTKNRFEVELVTTESHKVSREGVTQLMKSSRPFDTDFLAHQVVIPVQVSITKPTAIAGAKKELRVLRLRVR